MKKKNLNRAFIILFLSLSVNVAAVFSPAPGGQSGKDTTQVKRDTVRTTQKDTIQTKDTAGQNQLQIDTSGQQIRIDTQNVGIDTSRKVDSALTTPITENKLTNFKLFIYIVLSILGLALFYYIFVQMLFKTFHKTRSTHQSMLLSWNLFFAVTIVWIFIIWGIVAEFWSSAAFMVTIIFLFIVALVMLIIAVKSK